MGAEPTKFPIIDFSDKELKSGTPLWDSLKVQVREALEEYGCFEASFNKVPLQLRKSFLDALKELFDLPLQTKMKNVSDKNVHGYVGQIPNLPLLEGMGIDDPSNPENVESFTQIMWPEGNPNFSKIIQEYSEQISKLDQIIRRMVLESLGVEQYMDEHFNSTHYLIRVMKYTAPNSNVPKAGQPAHTDKNIVTVLLASEVPGLQIETKDGQWIQIYPSPDSFVVMLGEFFHGWTNGRLHAPFHRVMVTGNDDRYSVGFFSMPKSGYDFQVPKELVDAEHPLLFKPFEYSQFLAFYSSEQGRGTKHTLKAFCGI